MSILSRRVDYLAAMSWPDYGVASCAAVLPAWQALRTDPRSALSLD
jgi:hypothetical protein